MAQKSAIEWTQDTANVFYATDGARRRRGWVCVKVSSGCTNCYAESLNQGFMQFGTRHRYVTSSLDAVELHFDRRQAEAWSRKRVPRLIFVNSMTDTFGEFYSDDWIFNVLDCMAVARQHTFQVLTKRAECMHALVTAWLSNRGQAQVPNHIHLIVSVENEECASNRIPWLTRIPSMHGLSVEPLVGPIPTLRLAKIHWVILGGESGPKARPMQYRWAADIRDQCIAAEVPFFFKQWGKLASDPDPSDPTAKRNGGKAKGGRMLDGRTWDGMPLRRPAGVGGLVDGNEAKRERRVAQHASVEMDTP